MTSVSATTPTTVPPRGAKPGGSPTGPPSVPPAIVPLTFLVAAAIGLVGFGVVLAFAADGLVVDPRSQATLAAVHLGLLAFLSTAVLGALHQFAPVVGVRSLRSITVGRLTPFVFFAGAVALPTGFAHGPEWLVPAGGAVAFTGIALAAWNLSQPLSSRGKGTSILGLRLSVSFLVATAAFGVVYAFDRHTGWFPLLSNRVLAHAHLGLLGWLGLTYVAVAEKLWPMFLLAHRPQAHAGDWAVRLLATGTALLVPGLLFGAEPLAIAGGSVAIVGLGAHLVSLAGVIRHRRRHLELLHAFVLASSVALVAAVALGVAAGLADVGSDTRARLAAGEVAALFGWITLAVIGHAHKIVPFIAWSALRERGFTNAPDGGPLLFAHLFDERVARATFVVVCAAVVLVVTGILAASSVMVLAAGCAFAAVGVLVLGNLGLGPRRLTRAVATSRALAGSTEAVLDGTPLTEELP